MDGVSSASGIFAIVSLAIELASAIKKIVEFGKAVENAPTHICAIFNDLEILAAIISQIQQINGHTTFDDVSEKALQNCLGKVAKLQNKIEQAQPSLKSKSPVRRKWGAFNITLKKDEIQSLQRSIEQAKSTLQLAQTKSLLELVFSTAQNQEKAVIGMNTITSLINQSAIQEARLARPKMHVDDHGDVCQGMFLEDSQETSLSITQINSTKKIASIVTSTYNSGWDNTTPFTKASRSFDLRKRDCQSSRQFNLHTPFVVVSIQSRASRVKTIHSLEVDEASETDVTFIIYPKAGARLFGISYGMLISAKSTTGWQYSVQPFRAVPETALIFDFCRDGNLEGVRSLFKRGEASPWDRDPKGQTPLLVASQSLQLDIARLLLQEGADPHTASWDKGNEPIRAVVFNKTVEIEPKLAMINLLQTRRHEDYDDFTIGNMIWHALVFYRPQNDLSIPWVQRRVAVLKLISTLLPFYAATHPHRAEIIHKAVKLCFDQEVLQCLLRTTNGYIDLDLSISSIVHEALHRGLLERDPASMKLIVQKTKDPHRGEIQSCGSTRIETPTMLAMYDMRTFVSWRRLLHELGHETLPFVERELKEGALRDDGWTVASLTEAFETGILPDLYYGPLFFGFPNCERCEDNGTMDFAKLKVDLLWRRYLRDMRRRHSHKTTESGAVNALSQEEAAFNDRRPLPYRIVCSDTCRDGTCVAWVYEDDSNDEPNLPLFPSGSPLKSEDIAWNATCEVMMVEESCPTASMPGALYD